MNNRQNAKEKIVDFLASDKKALLLTGTHQNEKHVLVLHSIVNAGKRQKLHTYSASKRNERINLDIINEGGLFGFDQQ